MQRLDNYQATVDRLRCIKRWLIPVMADDEVPGRHRRWGLTPEDFGLVCEGRACPLCRACWQDQVRLVCPACGHERSAADFLEGVKEWQDYQQAVEHAEANPVRTETPSASEVMEQIARDAGVRPGVRYG